MLPVDLNGAQLDISRAIAADGAIYAALFAARGDADELARKKGVLLASVRIGIHKAWNLVNADISTAQSRTPDWYNARHVATFDIPDNPTAADMAAAFPNAAVLAHYMAIRGNNDLMQPDLLAKFLKFGSAVPAVTGVVLVKTDNQHHFTDPHKNIFRAVMRQILGSLDDIPFGLSKEDFEDIVAHKAAHPINTGSLVGFARNDGTRVRLMAAGIASAAVRIPAQYPPESAMSAVRSLLVKVGAIAARANVAMEVEQQVDDVENLFHGIDLNTPDGRAVATTRATAYTTDNGVDLGRCIGILQAVCEHAQIAKPDLLKSYALRRVIGANPASVAEGSSQMETYYRVLREKGRRGIIPGLGLFGAPAPPPTDPLPADETMAQILQAVLGNNARANGAGRNNQAPGN